MVSDTKSEKITRESYVIFWQVNFLCSLCLHLKEKLQKITQTSQTQRDKPKEKRRPSHLKEKKIARILQRIRAIFFSFRFDFAQAAYWKAHGHCVLGKHSHYKNRRFLRE
jgi:hypothetical protein